MEATNKKYIEYGRRLKSFRTYNKVSRKAFADKVGCAVRTLDRWESGHSYPMSVFKKQVNNSFLYFARTR